MTAKTMQTKPVPDLTVRQAVSKLFQVFMEAQEAVRVWIQDHAGQVPPRELFDAMACAQKAYEDEKLESASSEERHDAP